MGIRTRLLSCLFILSALILIVGMIFYCQLKALIEPLTPQSIPSSVERLENRIIQNSLIYHLLYQQQAVQINLEDYVLSENLSNLQDYYMNKALFMQLLDDANQSYPELYSKLKNAENLIEEEEDKIIKFMKSNNVSSAKKILISDKYLSLRLNIISIINDHYIDFHIMTNANDVITLKLAAKNTSRVLYNSMNTAIIIFLDALLISILIILFGTNIIWRPLKLLRNNMEDITKKNLDTPINTSLLKFKGEIGDLARSYEKLISSLRLTTVSRDKLRIEIERRMQSEENLKKAAQRLEESNFELDQFAYSVSHDLRAPLRGIQTLCAWIREDSYNVLSGESKRHFDLLQKRADRLDSLIHGILEYSRVGKAKLHMEYVDLNKLLVEIIDTLNPPKQIRVEVDMHMPAFVTYKALISQVFLNLISNAIKYLDKPQGHISVGYEDLEGYYKFYIKDDGPGVDPRYHKKIFELFQKLQSRDTIEGAGIGLSLVKKIVEKQGGTIDVVSSPGQGSTFYFTWPKRIPN